MYRYKYIDVNLYEGGSLNFVSKGYETISVDFNSSIGGGTFQFINENNKLNIIITSPKNGYYNPFLNRDVIWDINELTIDVLKISTNCNGVKYEILFNG